MDERSYGMIDDIACGVRFRFTSLKDPLYGAIGKGVEGERILGKNLGSSSCGRSVGGRPWRGTAVEQLRGARAVGGFPPLRARYTVAVVAVVAVTVNRGCRPVTYFIRAYRWRSVEGGGGVSHPSSATAVDGRRRRLVCRQRSSRVVCTVVRSVVV